MNAIDTSQFTGTSTWWRHPLNLSVTYTDGARHVAEKGKAYWLLDRIALSKPRNTNFQVWNLEVNDDSTATITVTDADDNLIETIELVYTDFPPPGVKLFFIDNVILVPSEY